ncbi:MAG: Dna2/Cas4 domain-containing protein [Actinobacteria bacterium]|nr:Dna2/Cas4 domain-containing protein [Actinomycetota bacterium]MSY04529.1 Dna2/Cas4 domain-containing protein [Actinomycetota bacterium]
MKFSPSELEVFQSCPQRFIWSADPDKKRHQGNLPSSLGKIAHKVLASAHKGGFKKLKEENREFLFNKIWNTVEQEEFERVQSEWPNTVVPRPIRWPKYFAVKSSTQYLVERALNSGEVWKIMDEPSERIGSSQQPFPWVEKFLESEELKLKGIPDLVKETSFGLEIVDYKTGNVTDPETFSMQMHIYLMLVNELSNLEVTRLLIRDFTLKEKEIPIDQMTMRKIKDAISSAEGFLIKQSAPAKVSLENCRFCNFKDICNDFQNSNLLVTSDPVFLEGEILQVHSNADSSKVSLQLLIQRSIPKKFKGSIWISGLSVKPGFGIGDIVQVMDNLHLTDSLNVVGSWNTVVCKKAPS